MILTEYGLHFAKEGDRWRCGDWPDLVMLLGDRYRIEGSEQDLPTLAAALSAELYSQEEPPEPGAARPRGG